MRATGSFGVYLTEEAATAVDGDPLVAEAVDFYDSGVWVTHADGRDFFPYGRVVRIREDVDGGVEAAGDDAEAEAGGESEGGVGERRDAAGGTAGSVDGSEPNGA
jgi:hypothetical protein